MSALPYSESRLLENTQDRARRVGGYPRKPTARHTAASKRNITVLFWVALSSMHMYGYFLISTSLRFSYSFSEVITYRCAQDKSTFADGRGGEGGDPDLGKTLLSIDIAPCSRMLLEGVRSLGRKHCLVFSPWRDSQPMDCVRSEGGPSRGGAASSRNGQLHQPKAGKNTVISVSNVPRRPLYRG